MGVVQFGAIGNQVEDYFVADSIACYDSLVGCLNLELGLRFRTVPWSCGAGCVA